MTGGDGRHVLEDGAAYPLERLSTLPGRIRWRAQALYGNEPLAAALARALSEATGVVEQRVNPRTGRVLAVFGAETDGDTIEGLLLAVLAAGVEAKAAFAPDEAALEKAILPRALPASATAAGAAAAALLRIVTLGRAVDAMLKTRPSGMAFPVAAPALWMGGNVAATLAYAELRRRSHATWHRLGQEVVFDLRSRLAQRLLHADFSHLDTQSTNRLAAIVQHDFSEVERGFEAVAELAAVAANTALMTSAFILLAPRLAWIPLVALGGMTAVAAAGLRDARGRYDEAGDARTALDRRMTEALDALPTVKAYGLEQRLSESIAGLSRTYAEKSGKQAGRSIREPLRLEVITMLGVSTTVLAGAVALGAGRLTPGTHLVLMMISGHLFYPFSHIAYPLESLHRGLAAYRELDRIARFPVESDGVEAGMPKESGVPSLSFHQVGFAYHGAGGRALDDVTLTLPAGGFIGIVGASGSGKSTLAKLLVRLYDPAAGAVCMDGVDIRSLQRRALRDRFAVVEQRSFLFEGSIADNIGLGMAGADRGAIEDAAEVAQIDRFIRSLPEQYDTQVGVRGAKLSDGQRQRILIARAVLRSAPVLILDEATSALDVETERAVLAAVRARSKGRTTILIAHRLASVRKADFIVVLDQASVAGVGTHRALARSNPCYRALLRADRAASAG